MQSQLKIQRLKIHGAVCFRGAVRRDTVNEVGMVTRSGPENATEASIEQSACERKRATRVARQY